MEPINTEIPQVKRHCRQREKEGADQERTRRPIDTVCWDAEGQSKNTQQISPGQYVGRPRITSFFVQV